MKKEVVNSLLAGVLIAIGGTAYLSCENKIFGSVLFSVALLCICAESFSLYTGKVCYALNDFSKKGILKLGITLICNFVAAIFCALILKFTNLNLGKVATLICAVKINKTVFRTLIDSIFCGILIYLAVDIYKKYKSIYGILICVPVFILSGFEHCVADIFYFAISNNLDVLKVFKFTLIAVLGNTIGGLAIPLTRIEKVK